MANTTTLTLGQAAKEVGISKPSLSAAIKKGRLSAHKNESGAYEIDPAELFRVYPPKSKTNPSDKQEALTATNPGKPNSKNTEQQVLDLLLSERDKLIAEKERTIQRLEQEKAEIREDLEQQREQAKRITLLLEDKTKGAGGWENAIQALEQRIANQESSAKQERDNLKQKAKARIDVLTKELERERTKSFWQRLFG